MKRYLLAALGGMLIGTLAYFSHPLPRHNTAVHALVVSTDEVPEAIVFIDGYGDTTAVAAATCGTGTICNSILKALLDQKKVDVVDLKSHTPASGTSL
jgi:hypothetical protein